MPLFPLSQTAIWASALAICILLSVIYGLVRLGEERPGKQFKASIIQGNIEQDKKWEPAYQNEVIDIYKDLSLRASYEAPSLIVWPESAVPFIFGEDRIYANDLLELQSQLGFTLLFGSVLIKRKEEKPVSPFEQRGFA